MTLLRVIILAACLAGCAAEPRVALSPQIAAERAGATPAQAVGLMRRQGEMLARRPFLPGNTATLLVNGPAAFAALSSAIEGAQTRVDMESYEFDAQAGSAFARLLMAARARGVEVNLIYDGWGAAGTPPALFAQLRQAGVRVLEYNPLAPNARVPININDRDHRKLLCVDGRLAITGGVNISRVYQNAPAPRQVFQQQSPEDAAWRDTDVQLKGPVVGQFEQYFMQTWHRQKGPALAAPPAPPQAAADGILVEGIDGAPDNGRPLIFRTLLDAVALSTRSVHLTTGFFVPTPEMMRGFKTAARRGIEVSLIVPGRSTSGSALAAGRAAYRDLLEAGVHIHEYQGRILHAKTAVIDGAWSAVGSSNLDWRSTVWNNEIDAIVIDTGFGKRMEGVFAADLATSRSIDLATWRRRGLIERLAELKAMIMAELL